MRNDKHKLLSTARNLRETLQTIENLLDGYVGIEGNKNYVKYCLNKSNEAHRDDDELKQFYDDTYNVDMTKRKSINVELLYKIVERQFKLLDDIDTAGDMFKPKWCKFTSAVEQMQRLRWLVIDIEGDNKNEEGFMEVNGNCFKKEERIVLRLYSLLPPCCPSSTDIKSPFTKDQIDKLNNYQRSGRFHPYTCSKSFDECEVNQMPKDNSKDGILTATESGWVCPCGKYKQNWAHSRSLDI